MFEDMPSEPQRPATYMPQVAMDEFCVRVPKTKAHSIMGNPNDPTLQAYVGAADGEVRFSYGEAGELDIPGQRYGEVLHNDRESRNFAICVNGPSLAARALASLLRREPNVTMHFTVDQNRPD